MTPDTFHPGDVPALRRELLDWLGDGRGLRFHALMSHSAGSMMGLPHLDGHPHVMRTYAEMVVAHETRTLRAADLYYVTPEMTELVRAAAADLPAFAPDPDDFPTPSGLIVFGTPLVSYQRPEHTAAVVDGRIVTGLAPGADHEEIGVSACTWGPFNAAGKWARGGVWMSFYRNRAEMLANILDERIRDGIRADNPRLVPDNEYGIQYPTSDEQRDRLEQELAAKDAPAWTSYWAKHLMATLLLMRQPLVYQRTEPVRRGLRRQLERAGYPSGGIRILDARPRRYTTVPRDAEPDTPTGPEETEPGGTRKISVRFPVRGFWRNQWYPSRGVHRPRWIDPHWRGPEDAPIVHPERVRVLRPQPAERTPAH